MQKKWSTIIMIVAFIILCIVGGTLVGKHIQHKQTEEKARIYYKKAIKTQNDQNHQLNEIN